MPRLCAEFCEEVVAEMGSRNHEDRANQIKEGLQQMARSQNDSSRILPGVKACEVAEMGEGEERLMIDVISYCLFTLRPMTSVLSW